MPSARLTANGGSSNLDRGTTFSTNGFVLDNTSTDGVGIASVVLRMVPTLLPNLAFDPKTDTDGQSAGDDVNKDFTRDPGSIGTFQVTPTLTEAFSGGYRTLTLDFTGLGPGERLAFSIDQDPISIKGAGREDAANAGAIVGVELVGMEVTVTYTDGTVQTAELFTDGSLAGAEAILTSGLAAAPVLSVAGVAGSTATVGSLSQTVTLSGGAAFGRARILIVEGGAFAFPGNGYIFDAYEANKAVASRSVLVDLDASGSWTGTVTLSDGAGATDGINYLVAAMVDASGDVAGLVSDAVTLRVDPDDNAPPVVAAPVADLRALAGVAFAATLPPATFTDPDPGDALTVALAGLPEGIDFDAATGAIDGTATTSGVFAVTATATDPAGASASTGFVLAVATGLSGSADRFIGGGAADVVAGLVGNDRLNGGGGADWLWGDAGRDTLVGGGGDDQLEGGAGADRLKGGAGADAFRFADAATAGDTIVDFAPGVDALLVSASGFGGGLVAGADLVAAGRFAANTTGAATVAGLGQFVFETDADTLFWDADGAGGNAAVLIARFTNGAALGGADIAVVA